MKRMMIFTVGAISLFLSGCAGVSEMISGTACYILGPIVSTVLPARPQESSSRVPSQDEERRRRENEERRQREKEAEQQKFLAQQYFLTGMYAYKSFDFPTAINNFEKAINSGVLDSASKGQAYLFLGASAYLSRNKESAASSFRRAKELRVHMDSRFPPDMEQFYNNQ